MTPYSRAVWMVVLAGAVLSTAGVGSRLMDAASGLQIVFYRALGMTVFLAIYLARKNRDAC
jgi:TRAP-type C4-dicarboxylate transport system permease large subunit